VTVRVPNLLLAVVAAAAAALTPSAAAGVRPALAIAGSSETPYARYLVQVDPVTLRLVKGSVALGGHGQAWSFSSDRRRLVLGQENGSCTGGATTLRLVDVPGLRSLGDVRLVRNGSLLATGWAGSSRVLAVVGLTDCLQRTGRIAVLAVDAGARRVASSTRLRGDVVGVARMPAGLVLLLAPSDRIGSARLAVVDARGRVRTVALPEIRAGQTVGRDHAFRLSRPGLAVDPAAGRVFVVPAGERAAEIDLGSLRVRMHDLSQRRSAFARFTRWLLPSAHAKLADGPERQAVWLGDGLLAVTGTDQATRNVPGEGVRTTTTAAGLRLIDTRDWRYRVLSPKVSRIRLAGSLLLATGSSWDGSKETGAGLTAYTRSGEVAWRLLGDSPAWLLGVTGGGGFVQVPAGNDARTMGFGLRDGRLGRAVATPRYELLSGPGAPF
jgi:hypothetical protein